MTKVRYYAITAMFAALIIVTTAFLKIPSPLGYTHAGDTMIYLAAAILPGPFGFAAAAIGGPLADLLAGYPQWAIPTGIIKALNVLPFFLIQFALKSSPKRNKIIHWPNLLMLLPTSAVTIGGYFLADAVLYDWGAAVPELLPNAIQAAISAVLFVVLGKLLDSIRFTERLSASGKD